MDVIATDGGRRLTVSGSYLDEARECLTNAGRDQCLVLIRPGEYPGLRAAAVDVLAATFLEKDGVEPESYARHLAELEPQHFVLLLKDGPAGPVPVGAAQMSVHERRPPDSVRDIGTVFGHDVTEVCARTVAPSGRTLPDLSADLRSVAGVEALAVWPEYRVARAAPYPHLLYAQVIRYLVHRGVRYITAILDMRRGEVFTQLQSALRGPFTAYGVPIRPRVYWTEGRWAHLCNREVPLDADGQPLVSVPNCSAPAYIEVASWLDRIRAGDLRDRVAYSRIVGDGLTRYAAFDPSFERDLVAST
ncbi:hypothetical protein [Virgisporangium ochraceum]|uniref:hypothetical protein n=1 Tax=Virgisporangium ochraceum TaxID=65505 RepID=UPI0019456C8F|nr:hypothetical protein [Virgisporangium ochraceum]